MVCLVFPGEVSPNFSLANYIRQRAGLTGTKIMCQQVRSHTQGVLTDREDSGAVSKWAQ